MKELRKRDVRTKIQQLKSGRTIGGIPFTRGPLSYLLRNRFFVGEVVYKGEALPGPQPPILADIRNKPDADQMRQAHERRLAMLRARTPQSAPEPDADVCCSRSRGLSSSPPPLLRSCFN
jgi:hypothetical protein